MKNYFILKMILSDIELTLYSVEQLNIQKKNYAVIMKKQYIYEQLKFQVHRASILLSFLI